FRFPSQSVAEGHDLEGSFVDRAFDCLRQTTRFATSRGSSVAPPGYGHKEEGGEGTRLVLQYPDQPIAAGWKAVRRNNRQRADRCRRTSRSSAGRRTPERREEDGAPFLRPEAEWRQCASEARWMRGETYVLAEIPTLTDEVGWRGLQRAQRGTDKPHRTTHGSLMPGMPTFGGGRVWDGSKNEFQNPIFRRI